ncbi:MAG: ribonuclease Y [Planctomycetota bacterium]|jgi:ribonuclease Y|nr:ribonuclease Y [Planctomycetota bacterium]
MEYAIIAVVALVVGWAARHLFSIYRKNAAELQAREILAAADRDAKRRTDELALRGKAEVLAERERLEKEIRDERNELKQTERRLSKREDNLDQKSNSLDKKEQQQREQDEALLKRERAMQARDVEIAKIIDQQHARLHEIGKMSVEQARDEIRRRVEDEMEHEIVVLVDRANARAKEIADEKARHYIANAIARLASDCTAEYVVSTIELPSEEMKGRIIGREGRNIRAFENATGVDVIIDDTPGVVVLSGFEPVRREIAARTLTRLVADGRIHPARIEEVAAKVREEMDKVLEENGKQAALEVDVRGLRPREIMLLGRLKYRTSYGQNVLNHSRDVSWLAGMLAAELGLDEQLARRCGLLHDLGKAIDHEHEGTHPQLGADVAKMCGENADVIAAILYHHEPGAADNLYATVVQAADAISAARPGARRETFENYVKRLERLELVATNYPEVDKAFAVQAGRELRVIANAQNIGDADCQQLCRKIAKQIEDELTYPGEVKVTMIRENRFVEYAR